jgi:N6-L-threonylcarbamoyladenine synthase
MKPVLGIETSCDETAVAIVGEDGRIVADVLFSQVREHAAFGGVVPEIAARAHLHHLPGFVRQVLERAGLAVGDLEGVAATAGPGLIGGLIVGCQFGKGLAMAGGRPFVAVNHLEAHALTVRIPGLTEDGMPFPYALMLLSGGHSLCVSVTGLGCYERFGGTVDDAVGEAFDKVAKLVGLPWPGGPALEALAEGGDPRRFALPRPMLGREGCDLSFSGLKTAVAQLLRQHDTWNQTDKADLAASFQAAVAAVLADRAAHACGMMRRRHPSARALVLAGGVAANRAVRSAVAEAAEKNNFRLVAPPVRLCSDNAVMVAWVGIERLRQGWQDELAFRPLPRWPLEALNRAAG